METTLDRIRSALSDLARELPLEEITMKAVADRAALISSLTACHGGAVLLDGLRPRLQPLGTTIKKDGAAILQGFTALFVAQMAGVDRLADAFRTALNVIGVSANGVLLHAWENTGANKG